MNPKHLRRRLVLEMLAALAVAGSAAGCHGLLDVTNPGLIGEDQLKDPALQQLVVNGAIGEFQYAFGEYALWSGVLADESFTDHTNVSVREFSLHDITDINDLDNSVYSDLQRARASAEDGIGRLRAMLGADAAAKSLNVARLFAYGGYSYVLLGEGFCEAPVNLGPGMSSDQLLTRAGVLFDSAIAVATASGSSADATDIINMARVGAARAALKRGDATLAATYATQVPADYVKWAYYSSNSVRENNILNVPAGVSGAWLSTGPDFLDVNDVRVPHTTSNSLRGLNSNPIFPPRLPYMYSEWSPTEVDALITTDTDIKMATGLEAQYDVAEADGPTAATLQFVNERRAVGGKDPVGLSGDALMAELRTQRGLDFYLTGQRLGDLRRYLKAGIDLFPSGQYPITSDIYGDATCFIVPLSEKAANPNY